MSSTYTGSTMRESGPALARTATYGGLADAIGGIATIILAIIALAGVQPTTILPIAVIVFGATLLIQGGTLVSEYESIMFPAGGAAASPEQSSLGGLSTLFLVGVAGIVLGILALLGIAPETLIAISVIAFGAALLLSSNSVRHLAMMQTSRSDAPGTGAELLSGEMASGSASVQVLAGLAAIVLGILAIAGVNPRILLLAALIVLGSAIILTGSALTGLIVGFMRSTPRRQSMVGTPR
jgi:hypothetical protein